MSPYIREWRVQLGLSQEAAADKLKISQSKLSKLERNKLPLTMEMVAELSRAYGVEAQDLLFTAPQEKQGYSPQE